jgi:3-methyladenine DNA glycosylase AlkD
MIDHRSVLKERAEEKMAEFHARLIPCDGKFLGVRVPVIRKLAKEIAKGDWRSFIEEVDEEYVEYIMLHGMVVCQAKMSLDERLTQLRRFIPKVSNWAVCDTCQYRPATGERTRYWEFLQHYLGEPSEYGMRYAVIAILVNFIDDEHMDRVLEIMDRTKHDGYYLKMGVAWTVAECFVKFPEKTMRYLNGNGLDDFTYNRSLQKITESFRVSDDTKTIIRGMKRKKR